MAEVMKIVCPACDSRISFVKGDVLERCPACKTLFIHPDAVKVKAEPKGTVVQIEPLVGGLTTNGGK